MGKLRDNLITESKELKERAKYISDETTSANQYNELKVKLTELSNENVQSENERKNTRLLIHDKAVQLHTLKNIKQQLDDEIKKAKMVETKVKDENLLLKDELAESKLNAAAIEIQLKNESKDLIMSQSMFRRNEL